MQTCISRHPTAKLTLVGTRLGAKVAKAVMLSLATAKLTPGILGESLISSSTIRSRVQQEAVRLLIVRVSMRTPRQLQWLLHLIGSYTGALSATDALSSLAKHSLLYQVASFGLRGTVASAITTAALQVSFNTCTLLTSNAAFWRNRDSRMSLRQYRYELLTSLYTSFGTVAGGAAGAAVGSMVMPGIGTALGSVFCSVGGGYVPGYLREKGGPDDCCRKQAAALRCFTPLRMLDTADGDVLMSVEDLVEKAHTLTPSGRVLRRRSPKGTSPIKDAGGADGEGSGEEQATEVNDGRSDAEGQDEVVWLDFARAETPPGAMSKDDAVDTAANAGGEDGDSASSMHTSLRYSPSLALFSHRRLFEGGHGEVTPSSIRAAPQDTGALGSGASATASLSSTSSSWSDASDAATATTSSTARFEGRAKYVTASTTEELQEQLDKCGGESDVLFLFA
ncbi:hypothetical protein JKF63_00630 [Porcisia hertigi]|uniref:Uncharacterized protein n=1 Tax=Porcisia hertigi TaxID=2761500 RepID=A0A836I8L5_9TRYP|nr:hypothetical protein JKF63_00630 [Porcisia hertigi]